VWGVLLPKNGIKSIKLGLILCKIRVNTGRFKYCHPEKRPLQMKRFFIVRLEFYS